MTQQRVFMRAEWRKLIMANYVIDPSLLKDLVPLHTTTDLYEGKCYVSLVGFMFLDTRVRGLRIPYHINFEEVNLRFYVKHFTRAGELRRGVCFVKEIVPRPAISMIANALYHEKYQTMPMRHSTHFQDHAIEVSYDWQYRRKWNSLWCRAGKAPHDIAAGSEYEFITEHYWGYTKVSETKTSEYAVEHPRWQVYDVQDYRIDVDFEALYGLPFRGLAQQVPDSVFLAEGSEVLIRKGYSF